MDKFDFRLAVSDALGARSRRFNDLADILSFGIRAIEENDNPVVFFPIADEESHQAILFAIHMGWIMVIPSEDTDEGVFMYALTTHGLAYAQQMESIFMFVGYHHVLGLAH
jgi:hypothetical protein